MKRSVNILSVLFLIIILFCSFAIAQDTSTELTQEEKDALEIIKNTSEATTEFITDVTKASLPKLKEIATNPIDSSKKLLNWTSDKITGIIGVTNSKGEDIWLWYYFFGTDIIMTLGILLIIVISTFLFAKKSAGDFYSKDFLKKWLVYSGMGIVGSVFVLSAINKTPFWKDFAFLAIVLSWMIAFFIFSIFYGSDTKKQLALGTSYLKYSIRTSAQPIKRKLPIIIGFSILYLLFQSIPILNIGLYIITLEFLGFNNFFFTWIIRPLIIALLLFFIKDIIDFYAKSKEKEKKFSDALKKKAIEEMNKASLGV